jgi:hypothetical protein
MDEPDNYQEAVNAVSQIDSEGLQPEGVITLSMRDIFAESIQVKKYTYDEAIAAMNSAGQTSPYNPMDEQRFAQKLAGPIRVADIAWISKRVEKSRKGGIAAAIGTDIEDMSDAVSGYFGSVRKARQARREAALKVREEKERARQAAKEKEKVARVPPTVSKVEEKPAPAAGKKAEVGKPVRPTEIPKRAPQPEQEKPQQVQPQAPRGAQFESEMKGAAEELGEIASKGSWLRDQLVSHISWKNEEDLVLLNLSVPEQIDELEKIGLGLDSNIFNKEQMRVIVEEVVGLKRKLMRNRVALGSQTELEALRDQRLSAVLEKLGRTRGY